MIPQRREANLADTDTRFAIAPRQTLLDAALAAGIPWHSGCRVGLCGSCRCRVEKGRVRALTDFSRVLDAQSLERGYVLACRSVAESDLTVAPDQLIGIAQQADHPAIVATCRPLAPTVLELELELEQPLERGYRAGQYARLEVPGQVPGRCFSFAGACRGDTRLRFLVRVFPGGKFSDWLVGTDRRGQSLTVSRPLGEFTLAEDDRPVLLICAGTGLAPAMAMVEELVGDPRRRPPLRLVYAARDRDYLYWQERLEALGRDWPQPFEFVPVLSREAPDSGWTGLRGHVHDHLESLTSGFTDARAYLCGPAGLVDFVELSLVKLGWPRTSIRADRFLAAF
ncbi:MAG: 2Fe-2S iron-sulfur cluster binding domain-containing protein [Candidatus Competibacteraceae bacterium]|nr:2Fe-2S iron-sulfur cluster binding domain-containing protein [Candidatus Competibacteraceae bacterium]